ncbi:MAG: OsmC family protein [Planctomycetes bacterium]|nr:OsmC family protein [Planctomycetota bacterium]
MKAVATLGPEGFRTEIRIDPDLGHAVVADEPEDKGGGNAGPTAFGLLASALAACTVATIRSYANLKGIKLARIVAEVDAWRRTPSEQNEAGPNAKMAVLHKKITIEGELSDEQRQRMLQIAEKCPVNRTLLEGADIVHA